MSRPDPAAATDPPRLTARAEPVGSLLRPDHLLRARRARAEGRIGPGELKRAEDRAVDEAVALQEEAGLPVVTDGEMRRTSFQAQMTDAVDGFGDPGLEAFVWGRWKGDADAGDRTVERPPGLGVTGRLRQRRSLSTEEFVYLRAATSRIAKITLPSPLLFLNFWPEDGAPHAYADVDAFLSDVVEILRREVRELRRLGCRYVQIDAPHYPLLRDPESARFYEARGRDREAWTRISVELENTLMDAARRPQPEEEDREGGAEPGGGPDRSPGDRGRSGMTFGLHMCRGNQGSRWLATGDYTPLADTVFQRTRARRLLLEYDDARAGGFEPLDRVPAEKTVVLGLVTTKRSDREDPTELAARVRGAARHVPLERLAVSPQCGFATSVLGNRVDPDAQARKLRVLVETAERVWGGA